MGWFNGSNSGLRDSLGREASTSSGLASIILAVGVCAVAVAEAVGVVGVGWVVRLEGRPLLPLGGGGWFGPSGSESHAVLFQWMPLDRAVYS